jgi:peptide/nickel transport system substrate-binding protein
MKTSSVRLAVGVLLCTVAACGGDGPGLGGGERPERGGTAVIVASSDLGGMNGLLASETYTQEAARALLFLPLLRYGPALELEPLLAESFELDGDSAVLLRLRGDVRWHDGTPTTAHDVAFTFLRAKDPATGYPNPAFFMYWTDVEVLDSLTVRFRFLPHADPLAGVPFFPIMPRHLLDTIPPARLAQAEFNRRPVGNGPFRFVEYRANDRWVFEANPDFPAGLGGPPLLDRLVWRVVPEASAQVTELQTGGADLAINPRADQVQALAADPGLNLVVKPGRQYAFIAWNGRRPPLDDARVRRALTLAINRQQLVDALRAGFGEPAVGPIGPHHWSFDGALEPLPWDTAAARALLAEAGILDRNGDGMLEMPDGSPFTLELKLPAGSAMNRDIGELVRNDLAALGIRFTTRPVEFASMIGDISPPGRNFDGVLLAWQADFRVNLGDLFHSGRTGGLYQFAGYANPEVDALIEQTSLQPDRRESEPLLRRLQLILREEQPWTFLYYYPDLYLARERLRGVEMDVRGVFINVGEWWIPAAQQGRPAGQPGAPGAPAQNDSAGRSPSPEPAR